MGTVETADSRSKYICVFNEHCSCELNCLLHVTMLLQLIREHMKAAIQYYAHLLNRIKFGRGKKLQLRPNDYPFLGWKHFICFGIELKIISNFQPNKDENISNAMDKMKIANKCRLRRREKCHAIK